MFKKLVSMLAAVAVFRNHVLGNGGFGHAARQATDPPPAAVTAIDFALPTAPFRSDSITMAIVNDKTELLDQVCVGIAL